MDAVTLQQITAQEVEKYAGTGHGIGLRMYFLYDPHNHVFAVNAIDDPIDDFDDEDYEGDYRIAAVIVIARVEGDIVIVEDDATDKPLVDALIQRGIPRSQIVLAYAGEPIPAPAESK